LPQGAGGRWSSGEGGLAGAAAAVSFGFVAGPRRVLLCLRFLLNGRKPPG
jgi:hypothetical protein